MPKYVQCASCGFLALRKCKTREITEAEMDFRRGGGIPSHGNELVYDDYPLCFVQAVDLRHEIEQVDTPGGRKQVVLASRNCDSFTPWIQGFTPKEHADMKLLEQQQAWNREMAEAERAWRERQEERQQQWRREDMDRQRLWREEDGKEEAARHLRELLVMGGVVTAVSVAAQIAVAILSWWLEAK